MAKITKSLLQLVFSGAYMKRWNDKLRPSELQEIDKQAHKMIVAWLLCRLSGAKLDPEEQLRLELRVIEEGIFDYFFRLAVTDIKPPVFYKIKEKRSHYRRLTAWVMSELEPVLGSFDQAFWERFCNYLSAEPEHDALHTRILQASHIYASRWEFSLIKELNSFDDEIPEVMAGFERKLTAYNDLPGVTGLINYGSGSKPNNITDPELALGRFANLCGQLRFQKRWSQTPRIPETSVMGHMFLVACYGYFMTLALQGCTARKVNNFFTGLFHDLPEVLTRDIIAPVKKSVEALDSLIKEYENEELERRIFNPLNTAGYTDIVARLHYYLGTEIGSEFAESIVLDKRIRKVSFEDVQGEYNQDRFDPKDGKLLKSCDILAAFIEAHTAVRNGINSGQLHEAIWRLRTENMKLHFASLHIGGIFADFD